MRKTRGFTLVELLVVIGIIALLISILLPSLARARQYAVNVQCQANLRSVGQGLLFYANDHKGKLPMSGQGGNPANGDGWYSYWPAQVTLLLGGQITRDPNDTQWGNFIGNYAAVLRCPAVGDDMISPAWNGGFHYQGNCRAMPRTGVGDWYALGHDIASPFPPGTPLLKPYPMATQNAAAKALLWDGPLLTGFGYSTATDNTNQWWWYLTWGFNTNGGKWGNLWADPFPYPGPAMTAIANSDGQGAYSNANPSSAAYIGLGNRDCLPTEMPWTNDLVNNQRYRHLGNTSCNLLFFDGHVEARKIGEITFGDLSIYPYH